MRPPDRCRACGRPAEEIAEQTCYDPIRRRRVTTLVGWCDRHNPIGYRVDWLMWPTAVYERYRQLRAAGCGYAVGVGYVCRRRPGALDRPCDHIRAAIAHADDFLPDASACPIPGAVARPSRGAAS